MRKRRVLILSQAKCGSTTIFRKARDAMPAPPERDFEPADLSAAAHEVQGKRSALCKYPIRPATPAFDPNSCDLLGSLESGALNGFRRQLTLTEQFAYTDFMRVSNCREAKD